MGGRRGPVLLALVLVAVLAAAGSLAVLGGGDGGGGAAAPAAESVTSRPEVTPAPSASGARYQWYLALGDSLATGYQPSNPGDRTDRDGGYAGLVRDGLGAGQEAPPELVNLGCPGETSATFVDGGRCPYGEGSQLAAAQAFLAEQSRDGATGLITVQVGANDVQRCLTAAAGAPSVDEDCVADGLQTVESRLPALLGALRQSAPESRIVVLDYYNPFAAAALLGAQGAPLAARSRDVAAELNGAIADAASGVGADVAAVGEVFAAAPVAGASPTGPDVGQVCAWTWMCGAAPDVHATSSGYAAIADEVLEAIRSG